MHTEPLRHNPKSRKVFTESVLANAVVSSSNHFRQAARIDKQVGEECKRRKIKKIKKNSRYHIVDMMLIERRSERAARFLAAVQCNQNLFQSPFDRLHLCAWIGVLHLASGVQLDCRIDSSHRWHAGNRCTTGKPCVWFRKCHQENTRRTRSSQSSVGWFYFLNQLLINWSQWRLRIDHRRQSYLKRKLTSIYNRTT